MEKDSYQSQVNQYVAWQKGQNQKWGRGMFVRERKYVHLRLKLNCTYCFSHLFQASGMEWPSPHDGNKLLWAARNGDLQKFKTLLDTFDMNFQAGANAHSEDDQAPTLNIYASEHEIPIEWQGHILENALAAFHEGRTSLHMAASNGHVDIVSYICGLKHSRRVNVNIVDKLGYTAALHLAAHSQCHGSCNKVIAEVLKITNVDANVVAA